MFRRRFGFAVILLAFLASLAWAPGGWSVGVGSDQNATTNATASSIPAASTKSSYITVTSVPTSFPYISTSMQQRGAIINAFAFQMAIFSGLSGTSATSFPALRMLAVFASIVGALFIFFFPKYQKVNIVVPWLIVVTITVMAPFGSKLLFYPTKSESSKTECESSGANCGFTPQLVAIHIAATMQRILSDLFHQQGWVDLLSEAKANQALTYGPSAVYFKMDDSWRDDFQKFRSCGIEKPWSLNIVTGTLKDETPRLTTFGQFWSDLKTYYGRGQLGETLLLADLSEGNAGTDTKKLILNSPPPLAVLYDEIPSSWGSGTGSPKDAYLHGIKVIYNAYNPSSKVNDVVTEGDTSGNKILLKDALTAIKKNGFFTAFDSGYLSDSIAPGFFFSLKSDLTAGGSDASGEQRTFRSCYFSGYNTVGNAFITGCPSISGVTKSGKSVESQVGLMSGAVSGMGGVTWRNFRNNLLPPNLDASIADMPIGVAYLSITKDPTEKVDYQSFSTANAAFKETSGFDCTQAYYNLASRVLGAQNQLCAAKNQRGSIAQLRSYVNSDPTCGSKTDPLVFSQLKSLLLPTDGGTATSSEIDSTAVIRPDQINKDGQSSGGFDVARQDDPAYKENNSIATTLAAALTSRLRECRSTYAISSTSDPRNKACLLDRIMELAYNATIMQQEETAGDRQSTRDGSTVTRVGNETLTSYFGTFAFGLGKVGAKVAAIFSGGLAQAFVFFLSILVDMALMALIILTPILFVFGVVMPSAAPGLLVVTTLGVFILKAVPITLIILNNVAGLIKTFLVYSSIQNDSSFTEALLILAMGGLYMNIVGMTFFMLFKIGSPEAILGRLQGLDSAAKQMAETGKALTITAAGLAAATGGAALTSGFVADALKRKALGMIPGGDLVNAAMKGMAEEPNKNDPFTSEEQDKIRDFGKQQGLSKNQIDDWIKSGDRSRMFTDPETGQQFRFGFNDKGDLEQALPPQAAVDPLKSDRDQALLGGGVANESVMEKTGEDGAGDGAKRLSVQDLIAQDDVRSGMTQGQRGNLRGAMGAAGLSADQQDDAVFGRQGKEGVYADTSGNYYKAGIDKNGAAYVTPIGASEAQSLMAAQNAGPDGQQPGGPAIPPALGGPDAAAAAAVPGAPLPGGGAPGGAAASTVVVVQGGQLGSIGEIGKIGGVEVNKDGKQASDADGSPATPPVGPDGVPPEGSIGSRVREEVQQARIAQLAKANDFMQQESARLPSDDDVKAKFKALKEHSDAMDRSKTITDEDWTKYNTLSKDYISALSKAGDADAVKATSLASLNIKRDTSLQTAVDQVEDMKRQARAGVDAAEQAGNRLLADRYRKAVDEINSINPLAMGQGEFLKKVQDQQKILNQVGRHATADTAPGFWKGAASGLIGSISGGAGGLGSIPVIGKMIKESVNEFYQGPERARAWNTAGGFWKHFAAGGDAQRMAFYQKEMGPLASGEMYRQMFAQGTFQAQADLARQAAVEAVARQRSQFDALQYKLGELNLEDREKGRGGDARTHTMKGSDLVGLGRQDAISKVSAIYAESVDMRQGKFNIEMPEFDSQGYLVSTEKKELLRNPDGSVKRDASGKALTTAPTVMKNMAVLGDIYGSLAAKSQAGTMEDALVKYYGIWEKRFNRQAKEGWANTKNITRDAEAISDFMRMDPDSDYLVAGHVKMAGGKRSFFKARGDFAAYKELMMLENDRLAQAAAEVFKEAGVQDVTAQFRVTPNATVETRDGTRNVGDLMKKASEQVAKQFEGALPLQSIFAEATASSKQSLISKSTAAGLFNKEMAALQKTIDQEAVRFMENPQFSKAGAPSKAAVQGLMKGLHGIFEGNMKEVMDEMNVFASTYKGDVFGKGSKLAFTGKFIDDFLDATTSDAIKEVVEDAINERRLSLKGGYYSPVGSKKS